MLCAYLYRGRTLPARTYMMISPVCVVYALSAVSEPTFLASDQKLYQVSPAGSHTFWTAPSTSVVTGMTMIDGPHMYCRSWE